LIIDRMKKLTIKSKTFTFLILWQEQDQAASHPTEITAEPFRFEKIFQEQLSSVDSKRLQFEAAIDSR